MPSQAPPGIFSRFPSGIPSAAGQIPSSSSFSAGGQFYNNLRDPRKRSCGSNSRPSGPPGKKTKEEMRREFEERVRAEEEHYMDRAAVEEMEMLAVEELQV